MKQNSANEVKHKRPLKWVFVPYVFRRFQSGAVTVIPINNGVLARRAEKFTYETVPYTLCSASLPHHSTRRCKQKRICSGARKLKLGTS